jgi:hypothetical protein
MSPYVNACRGQLIDESGAEPIRGHASHESSVSSQDCDPRGRIGGRSSAAHDDTCRLFLVS